VASKEWSIGIFGIITDGKGKILVSRRSDGQGWDLPGAGVDSTKDRDFMETLRREVREETGLSVEGNPVLIGAYPDFSKKDVMVLYFVPRVLGEPMSSDESPEHRFVDFATLKKEICLVWQGFPGDEHGRFWEMVRDGFAYVNYYA
jgi:8-oxo-dGTP pyrophosphatase MutT (NUDIX family)